MRRNFIALILSVLLFYTNVSSQTVPVDFTTATIGSGWSQPVGATFNSDGTKLFVWEKAGRVYVCNRNASGNYIKQSAAVIDISQEVGDWRDHGLLGFAVDPQFNTNGFIYLLYNVDRHHLMNFGTPAYNAATNDYLKATIGRVTRYKTATAGDVVSTNYSTRLVLIGETRQTGIPLLYESHGVGSLAFASDGTLLVTTGDGASYSTTDPGSISHTYYQQALTDGIITPSENVGAFRSQLLNSLCGKLLRIDPTNGNGVGSNPFFAAATPRSAKSRIWAMGFRNPFRMTIKPGTGSANPSTGDIGEVYVGDVGWNVWEELNIIDKPGMNCGWPLFEGHNTLSNYYTLTTENPDEANPLFNIAGCTQQKFMFKDLLKQATADNNKTVFNSCNAATAIGTGNRYFHRRPTVDWKHGADNARVGIFNGNDAATADIGTPESKVIGSQFRGNTSIAGCWYNGNTFPVKYRNTFFQADYGGQWLKSFTIGFTDVLQKVENFATGFVAIVSIVQNPITTDGSLVVVDIGNNTIKRISYGGNQAPTVVMTSNKMYGPSVLNVGFNGSGSFDQPGGSIASYLWNFGDNTTSAATNPTHNFTTPVGVPAGTPVKFVVKLTVTDNQGAASTDSLIISLNNTPPVVNITSPAKNSIYKLGGDTLYSCTAAVTDAEHTSAQLTYAWQTFLRHNNHQHPEVIDNIKNTQTAISRIGCNGDDYYWLITLKVTDAAGLSAMDSSKIFPGCFNSPLDLVLRSFSVTQSAGANLVKWTTELEDNIDYFEVERSTDGINFLPVQRLAARNIASATTYSFTDNSFGAGINFYRLKIKEKGLIVKYSIIIRTTSENIRSFLSVSPNPVSDVFSITCNALQRGNATIEITDMNGRKLFTIRENVSEGNNVIYIKDLPGLGSGMYLITFRQGNNVRQGKFIKSK